MANKLLKPRIPLKGTDYIIKKGFHDFPSKYIHIRRPPVSACGNKTAYCVSSRGLGGVPRDPLKNHPSPPQSSPVQPNSPNGKIPLDTPSWKLRCSRPNELTNQMFEAEWAENYDFRGRMSWTIVFSRPNELKNMMLEAEWAEKSYFRGRRSWTIVLSRPNELNNQIFEAEWAE